LIDTNTWKTKLNESWTIEGSDSPGAWFLFKAAALRHRMIADHLASEYPTKTAGQGRELYEWAVRPNRDNHLLDALLLAAVGGSLQGVKIPGESDRRIARRHVAMRRDDRSVATDPDAHLVAAVPVVSSSAGSSTAVAEPRPRKMSLSEMRAAKRQ
jgi:hypothetical protein